MSEFPGLYRSAGFSRKCPQMWQKILLHCKQFLFSNSSQINLPLLVLRNGLHCFRRCPAVRLTKIIIVCLCIFIYIVLRVFLVIWLTFQPSRQRSWKTIHGSLFRERGFPKWMKREFLMRDVLLSHFYSWTDFNSVVVWITIPIWEAACLAYSQVH